MGKKAAKAAKAKAKARAGREPLKIGVLISGSGTNLQAIIDAIAAGKVNARIVKVLSSRPDAFGLKRAEKAGIPTVALNRDVYADAHAANARIADEMREAGAEYLVMAGYMRMVGAEVLDAYPDRVVNLHPALLPSFVGAHAIQDAFDAGVKVTGVTVHFANAEYDKGPIIAQKAVPIREGDTLDELEARIHAAEHKLYPKVVGWIADGRVAVDAKRHVVVAGKKAPAKA
jgi:phosphoribosylglycinamide formyltransferase-1